MNNYWGINNLTTRSFALTKGVFSARRDRDVLVDYSGRCCHSLRQQSHLELIVLKHHIELIVLTHTASP